MSRSADASASEVDDDPDPRTVKARVKDPELLKALEEAEEDSSMAAVIRDSLRVTLLYNDDQEADRRVGMPDQPWLRDAYRTLVAAAEITVEGGGLRVSEETARERLYTNDTPKDAVMDELVDPLVRQGFADVDVSWEETWITVRPMAPNPSDSADCALCGAEDVRVFLTGRHHPAGRNYAACTDCHNVVEGDDV